MFLSCRFHYANQSPDCNFMQFNAQISSRYDLHVVRLHSYTSAMNFHLELVKVEPVSSFFRIQVMVAVSCCKTETVKAQVRGEQQAGRALLIGHTWIPTLPSPVEIGR